MISRRSPRRGFVSARADARSAGTGLRMPSCRRRATGGVLDDHVLVAGARSCIASTALAEGRSWRAPCSSPRAYSAPRGPSASSAQRRWQAQPAQRSPAGRTARLRKAVAKAPPAPNAAPRPFSAAGFSGRAAVRSGVGRSGGYGASPSWLPPRLHGARKRGCSRGRAR